MISTLASSKGRGRGVADDEGATIDDLREAVNTFEDLAPTARRVLGGAHPLTSMIVAGLRAARENLRGREAGKSVVFTAT